MVGRVSTKDALERYIAKWWTIKTISMEQLSRIKENMMYRNDVAARDIVHRINRMQDTDKR